MPDLTQYLPIVAVAALGVVWLSGNPKVKEYAAKVYSYLMSFKKNKKKVIPADEVADISEALELLSVHELLEELMARAEESSDTDGLMLLGAYGKHVYDLRLEPKPTTKKTTTKKGS